MAQQAQTTLITGASGGIGYELARLFAADGYRLVLVARQRDVLEKVAAECRAAGSPMVRVIAKDLAELETPDEIFEETERAGIAVDVLVNNAGFGMLGPFAESDLDTQLDILQVNVVALTHLTRLYLKPMVSRKRGKVINIGSTAAFVPGPLMAVYYASKAYVLSFSEALHEELRDRGVSVTCVAPGVTATGFASRAMMSKSKLFRRAASMDARTVAEIAYRGAMRGNALVITGVRNRMAVSSLRFAPRWGLRRLVRWLQEE